MTEWHRGTGSKDRMKASAVLSGASAQVQLRCPDTGYRNFGAFPSWEHVERFTSRVPTGKRHLFEIIQHEKPCKPYLDVDGESLPDGCATVEELASRIEALVIRIFDSDYGIQLPKDAFVWMHSPNQTKVSLHLVISTHDPQFVFTTNHKDHDQGACDLARRIKALDRDGAGPLIDDAVYTKDREMRMCGASKYEKAASVLVLMRPSRDKTTLPRDSVITWLDENVEFINVPKRDVVARCPRTSKAALLLPPQPLPHLPPLTKRPRVTVDARPASSLKTDPVPERVLRRLVMALDSTRANGYNEWLPVVMAIHKVGKDSAYDDDGMRVAIDFSSRSTKAYKSPGVVEVFRHSDARSSQSSEHRSVGMGSLLKWLEEDDPATHESIRAELKAHRKTSTSHTSHTPTTHTTSTVATTPTTIDDNTRVRFVEHVVARWPEHFNGHLSQETCSVTIGTGVMLFEGGGVKGRVTDTFVVYLRGIPGAVDTFLGPLFADVPVEGPLSSLHRSILPDTTFLYNRQSESRATLTSVVPGTNIVVYDPGTASSMVSVNVRGKEVTVDNRKKVDALQNKVNQSTHHHVTTSFGCNASSLFVNVINNGTMNIYNGVDPDAGRTTEVDLVVALIAAKPDAAVRFRFAPDAKSAMCNGLYYCDPVTNVWSQVHNAFVEKWIVDAILDCERLSTADERFVKTQRAAGELRKLLVREVLDTRFEARIDANLDLFALDNGTFDMRIKAFRQITPDDRIMKTAGWSYDSSLAIRHRKALEMFIATIIPVREERDVVLAFFAGLLSGRRKVKKLLVLTDRRAGNNGKTTLVKLFSNFFGDYYDANTKFVCKGSFDRDRDSHDAGTEPYRGKRLVVAEELKHSMALDEAMLKRLTGGDDIEVAGRMCGSGSRFKFVWQAGFVLVFNEGDCPKFDCGDAAFLGRMIVAPMRSKFVEAIGQDEDEYTFLMDKDVGDFFLSWRSALADLLMERISFTALDSIPASMREWRQGIAGESNPLAEWLTSRITITGNPNDRIVLSELKKVYGGLVPSKDFIRFANGFFAACTAAVCKPKDNVKRNGVWCSLAHVVRGVILSPGETPDSL